MYRIAPGGDGVPVAWQVASTGGLAVPTLRGAGVPAVIDFGNRNLVLLSWHLSSTDVSAAVSLAHVVTGRTVSLRLCSSGALWRRRGLACLAAVRPPPAVPA
ncbi:hypothetical protein ACFVU3_28940 [Streptomyces sp. NPDC058052]|uniref:hypothetical protein n=1 Tax=Streptomyces sp. NPDC058052 TaxID=3346316 RepID=UPI0036E0FA9A